MFEMLESRQLNAAITGLSLINANTGAKIESLHSGMIIDLAKLPTTDLNIVASVTGGVSRVKFNLDGHITNQTKSPFALAGDSNGKFNDWTPTAGVNALRVYAWDSKGHELPAKSFVFKVNNPVSAEPPSEPTDPSNPKSPTDPTNPTPPTTPTDPTPPADPVDGPPIAGNWNLSFDDEFSTTTLNTNTWAYRYWWNGNIGEMDADSPSAVTVSNGNLVLTATDQPNLGTDGNTYPYTSGMVTTGGIDGITNPGFSFTYGYVEARIKIPSGQGMWPAFWMLPTSHNDADGEIDIMEVIGSDIQTDQEHYHVHGTVYGHATDSGVDLSAGYHTYGVDWEKGSITWYLDGKAVYQVVNSDVISEPMYMILNLAVGGDWPGPPDSTTKFPATMDVDYVKVWQQAA